MKEIILSNDIVIAAGHDFNGNSNSGRCISTGVRVISFVYEVIAAMLVTLVMLVMHAIVCG